MSTDVEQQLSRLESEVKAIQNRNARVELDKKWEVSGVRFICVATVTYLTMILIFWSIGATEPTRNALVPTAGYMLSTLSLKAVKNFWLKKQTPSQN